MHAGDIFELLRDGRPWTRAELADATGLARSTIAATWASSLTSHLAAIAL